MVYDQGMSSGDFASQRVQGQVRERGELAQAPEALACGSASGQWFNHSMVNELSSSKQWWLRISQPVPSIKSWSAGELAWASEALACG